jgi:hypothetical protein
MMQVVMLILVVISALLAILSGVWVAVALIAATSARQSMPGPPDEIDQNSAD